MTTTAYTPPAAVTLPEPMAPGEFDALLARQAAAGDALAQEFIFAPMNPTASLATPPDPLAADMRRHYAALADAHQRYGFKPMSFEEWVESVMRDRLYGPGFEPGAAQDWLDR